MSEELRVYTMVLNQLQDPNLSAAINTADMLAPDTPVTGDPPTGALTGAAVLDPLRTFVGSIVAWLTAQQAKLQGQNPPAVDVPEPLAMSLPVDKNRPVSWSGDLRELRVDLLLRRANVESNIAALAPLVQSVTSPITPVQAPSTDDDPTGLSAFARSLEQAYYGFDGQPDGVIKVATGINSDLTSTRLGMPSLWLARWGETAGMTVEILNDDDHPPVYYAPPPLSTQLITRTVDQLIDYSDGANSPKDGPPKVFSSVDVDAVAAAFLSSVELIFSAPIAPQVADLSAPTADDIYGSYVGSKSDLAGYIADTLTYIYTGFTGDGAKPSDPTSATEAMRQALLTSLENDYGMSALVQMAALITLHGEIEPGAKSPPNIYGNIAVTQALGDGSSSTMPYNFTPAKLPLVAGTTWLNTLLSVQDPSLQNALTVPLAYQMGFIEYDIDPDETRCDYTPSNWLTFVLQSGSPDPGPAENTLTASMGEPRIPIPLRSYPPLPKLISATATQVNPGGEHHHDRRGIDVELRAHRRPPDRAPGHPQPADRV